MSIDYRFLSEILVGLKKQIQMIQIENKIVLFPMYSNLENQPNILRGHCKLMVETLDKNIQLSTLLPNKNIQYSTLHNT